MGAPPPPLLSVQRGRDEELPGRAGSAALKSLCSAQGLGAARQSVAPSP